MPALEEIEALLESGRREASAANGRPSGNAGSPRRRSPSPSGRSHTSSRSHRRSSHRDRSPRGDSRERSSRRSSHRDRVARDDEDDQKSSYSSTSGRRDRDSKDDRRSRDAADDDEDRERKRRRSSRDRSRDRDGDRDRHRDDRGSRDYRSSSHRSSRNDRERDGRSNGRNRDDNRRDRNSDERDSPRYNDRSTQDEPKKRSPSPPRMSEEEHEMRSVFVSQLSARVGDRELFQFFETHVGKVRDARVILDRVSRRSKGVAYVEFFELDDVRKAINLTGTRLLSIPIIVQYTEAERNRQAGMQAQPANIPEHITIPPGSDARGDTAVPWNRIYVGSLPFSLRENDIRQIFEPFGAIDVVDLHFDNITMKSKGYCFVQFRKHVDAQQALSEMNGFEIAGRPIRVGLVTEKGGAPTIAAPGRPGNSSGGNTGGGMLRPDSLEEGGGSLNNTSRYELMQKLARTEPAAGTSGVPSKPMFRVNVPTAVSKSILLKNMFNPAEETDPDWDTELRNDVRDESESKYGKITEIHLDRDSTAGEIYIRFAGIDEATKAIQGLNGRYFGGKQISANYISDAVFDAHRK